MHYSTNEITPLNRTFLKVFFFNSKSIAPGLLSHPDFYQQQKYRSEVLGISLAADLEGKCLTWLHLLTKVNKDVSKETSSGFSVYNIFIQCHRVNETHQFKWPSGMWAWDTVPSLVAGIKPGKQAALGTDRAAQAQKGTASIFEAIGKCHLQKWKLRDTCIKRVAFCRHVHPRRWLIQLPMEPMSIV